MVKVLHENTLGIIPSLEGNSVKCQFCTQLEPHIGI